MKIHCAKNIFLLVRIYPKANLSTAIWDTEETQAALKSIRCSKCDQNRNHYRTMKQPRESWLRVNAIDKCFWAESLWFRFILALFTTILLRLLCLFLVSAFSFDVFLIKIIALMAPMQINFVHVSKTSSNQRKMRMLHCKLRGNLLFSHFAFL